MLVALAGVDVEMIEGVEHFVGFFEQVPPQ